MTPEDVDVEATLKGLRIRVRELEAERDAYAAMLLGSEQERASLQISLDEQTFEMDEQRSLMSQQIRDQQEIMDAVWDGLSWRVTAPLRRITDLLKARR